MTSFQFTSIKSSRFLIIRWKFKITHYSRLLLTTNPYLKFRPHSPTRRENVVLSSFCCTNIADPSQSSENNVDPRSSTVKHSHVQRLALYFPARFGARGQSSQSIEEETRTIILSISRYPRIFGKPFEQSAYA